MIGNILNRFIEEFNALEMSYYIGAALIFAVFFFLAVHWYRFHKWPSLMNGFAPAYVFVVFAGTVLVRELHTGVNLDPLVSINSVLAGNLYYVYMIAINVALIMPFGFAVPFVYEEFLRHNRNKRKTKVFWITVVTSLLLTVSIELTQYFSMRGVFEIEDIIFNFVGALIGYFFYLIGRRVLYVYRNNTHRKHHRHRSHSHRHH